MNSSKLKTENKQKVIVKNTKVKTKVVKVIKNKPIDKKTDVENNETVIVNTKNEESEIKEDDFIKVLKENGIDVDDTNIEISTPK